MGIVQKIILGWLLLGLVGTILTKVKIIFLPQKDANLDDFPEHQRGLMEMSQNILKENPLLEFCIDLFLGLLYTGQWNFVIFIGWLLRIGFNLIKLLWWFIKKPFNANALNKRIEKLRDSIRDSNPSYSEQGVEDRIIEISNRWNDIYRKQENK